MNVKLQIKEVKEETRPITLEEKCMFLLSTDMHYSQKIRDEIEKRMDMLGLIRRVDSENILFRVETIRDATPEEIIAWQCIVSYNHCMTAPGLSVCSKSPGGYCCGWFCYHDRLKSYKLLRGKEVIVSLTEESI